MKFLAHIQIVIGLLIAFINGTKLTPTWELSATVPVMLRNKGIYPESINTFGKTISALNQKYVQNVPKKKPLDNTLDLTHICDEYLNEFTACWKQKFPNVDPTMLELVIEPALADFKIALILAELGHKSIQPSLQKLVMMPFSNLIDSCTAQTQSAIRAIESEMQLLVFCMHKCAESNMVDFVFVHSHYRFIQHHSFEAAKKCIDGQSGESLKVLEESVKWASQIFSEQMALFTASVYQTFGDSAIFSMKPLLRALPKTNPKIPSFARFSCDMIMIVDAAPKSLSKPAFHRFYSMINDETVYSSKDSANVAEFSNCTPKDFEYLTLLSDVFKRWVQLSNSGLKLFGVTDYMTAYRKFPSFLEYAKAYHRDTLATSMIEWAKNYESFAVLLDQVLNKLTKSEQPTKMVRLSQPLSQVLEVAWNEHDEGKTVTIVNSHKAVLQKEKEWLFGWSPVVRESIDYMLSSVLNPELRFKLLIDLLSTQGNLAYFHARLFTNKLNDDDLETMKILIDSDSPVCNEIRLIYHASMSAVIARFEFLYLLSTNNGLVVFHEYDNKAHDTLIGNFERLLVHSKWIRNLVTTESRSVKTVKALSTLIRKELKLTCMMGKCNEKILYAALCALETCDLTEKQNA